MKQLRRQYSDNWPLLTEVEREHRRQQVFRVVVTQLADLLAMVESVEVGEAEWTQRVHHERDSGSAIMMNPKLVECLVGVWENESVQAALEESREEDTFGDLEYFMNNADRVLRRDAVVSFEDWNHVNLQSTDVDSHKFELVGYTLSIVEIHDVTRVGGNRRKWEHMFEFADKLIYVVPINEFDQASLRDPRVNAIMDDMDAFARTVNNEFNWHKRVFLVFTNYALFCDKLQIMPIKIVDPAHPERNRWTDYTGVEGMSETFWDSQEEADQGIEYFKGKFLDLVERRSYRGKSLLHFYIYLS